jgi:hypothetical protein
MWCPDFVRRRGLGVWCAAHLKDSSRPVARRPSGFFLFWGEQMFPRYCAPHSGAVYGGDGDHMTLLNKIFTTRTLVQIIFVLVTMVIMKAASLHYDFSWATALAAG